jgi:hypothetical protein
MIGQYLPNNNENATVAFRQKICQLNSPIGETLHWHVSQHEMHSITYSSPGDH